MPQRTHELYKLLVDGFNCLGLRNGDNVFVHSSLIPIYYYLNITDNNKVCSILYESLRYVINDGVISCLSATWEVSSKGRTYFQDMEVSVDLGEFPEFLRKEKNSARTKHPVFSIIFNTNNNLSIFKTEEILSHRVAYGPGSPWQLMIEQPFNVIFIGLPGIEKLTLMHHVEQLYGVPYIYNKIVKDRWNNVFSMAVPYLNMNISYSDQKKLEDELIRKGIARFVKTVIGNIYCINMQEAALLIQDKLNSDFYYLLEKEPTFYMT